MESWIFLFIILSVGYISNNFSIVYPTIFVMFLKLFPFTTNIMTTLRHKGINWGVMILTTAILIPIATKEIGFKDLLNAFKSPIGWISIITGIGVSLLSAKGVYLLSEQPEITVALIIGTIIGVAFFRGVAAGPLIASGITFCILKILFIFYK